MKTIHERINYLLKQEDIKNPSLEKKTGIKKDSWSAARNNRTRYNEDHIEAIKTLWPEYAYWITTGETIPEAGQISPELEEQRQKLQDKVG